jgi:hypothetical protein
MLLRRGNDTVCVLTSSMAGMKTFGAQMMLVLQIREKFSDVPEGKSRIFFLYAGCCTVK